MSGKQADTGHYAVEDEVLKVYRRVLPSTRLIEDPLVFQDYLNQRKRIFSLLQIEPWMLKGKRVLDIGGGTGENSVITSMFGAEVTLVEPNEVAIERAQMLFRHFDQKFQVLQKSLFELSPQELDSDIVICEGVLQHTYEPLKGLAHICSHLRSGSVVMIGMAETSGWYKRELQRLAVRAGDPTESEIVERSKYYFREHLDRAIKYGLRDEKTIIYDTYVNPQIKPSPLAAIQATFRGNGVYHYSSFPSLRNPFDLSPINTVRADYFDGDAHHAWIDFLRKCWMVSGGDPETSVFEKDRGISPEKMFWINAEAEKLEGLRAKILAENFSLNDLMPIQRGYLGLGMNFFVGIKN